MTADACPVFRWRLFLSADLVGSTKFKTNKAHGLSVGNRAPVWVKEILKFYKDFPRDLGKRYEGCVKSIVLGSDAPAPRLWKTVGDELIFVNRIQDERHLRASMLAFLETVRDYRSALEAGDLNINVKGNCWIAGFPHPNSTIPKPGTAHIDGESFSTSEEVEQAADDTPDQFDFLGPHIDAGFRVAKNSSMEKCTLSLELAFLLAKAAKREDGLGTRLPSFEYHGREIFKGVIGEAPYPVVALETEFSEKRRALRSAEDKLRASPAVKSDDLCVFLEAFCKAHGLDAVEICEDCARSDVFRPPKEYIEYVKVWESEAEMDRQQEKSQTLDSEGVPEIEIAGNEPLEDLDIPAENISTADPK